VHERVQAVTFKSCITTFHLQRCHHCCEIGNVVSSENVASLKMAIRTQVVVLYFYCAMHYSAKRSLAIACRLSICPSVCLTVCDVGGS